MLARRLLALLAVEMLAYALVLHAAFRGLLPWHVAVAWVALAHVTLRCAVVPLGVVVAAAVEPRDRRRRLGPARAIAVCVRECAALWWNYVLAPFDSWLNAPGDARRLPLARGGARPPPDVILVHGIMCNRVVWRPFQAALARRGLASRAVNLAPLLGSLDAMAECLAARLHGARPPVVLVGHSMGGLVARRALQLHPELAVAGIVTIGTPHRGSVQAAFAPGLATRSMRRDSGWLAELERGEQPPPGTRRLAIRSLHDELVSPTDAALWQDATNLVVEGVGHVALLADERVIDAVAAELLAVDAAHPRDAPADVPDAHPGTEAVR